MDLERDRSSKYWIYPLNESFIRYRIKMRTERSSAGDIHIERCDANIDGKKGWNCMKTNWNNLQSSFVYMQISNWNLHFPCHSVSQPGKSSSIQLFLAGYHQANTIPHCVLLPCNSCNPLKKREMNFETNKNKKSWKMLHIKSFICIISQMWIKIA